MSPSEKLSPWEVDAALSWFMAAATILRDRGGPDLEREFAEALPQVFNKINDAKLMKVEQTELFARSRSGR